MWGGERERGGGNEKGLRKNALINKHKYVNMKLNKTFNENKSNLHPLEKLILLLKVDFL